MSVNCYNNAAKYLPGLDVAKFLMAVLLIAAHTGYLRGTIAGVLIEPLIGLAVPMFFALSAYLFFRKVFSEPDNNRQRHFLFVSVKRLIILFCCWYVLMLPMMILKGTFIGSIKEAVYVIFLTSAMWGYWFIKALIINTVLFFIFRHKEALILFTVISFIVYFYCSYNQIFHYNVVLDQLQPYYSFYYHMAYFSVGVWYARYSSRVEHLSKQCTIMLLSVWCLFYVVSLIFVFLWFPPLFRLISFALLFPVISKLRGANYGLYKTLRSMSIILYMVQFVIIWLYDKVCQTWLTPGTAMFEVMQHCVIRFVVVLLAACAIASFIVTLEQRTSLRFLRYLH